MVEAITVFSIAGAIIAIGFLANVLFKKTRFPDTLFLIIIGIVLGPALGVFKQEEMLLATSFLTTLTLMMILFEGGLNMDLYKVLSQSVRAAILAVLYVITATVFVSIFGYFVLKLRWIEALMLGPMTAGTSSVVIIPLISKLNVKEEVGITLSLESTITYLSGTVNLQQTVSTITAKFAVGILLGFIVGILWIKILSITRKQEYTYMFTIAALILSYVGSEILGGSGSLTALLFGLVLGNCDKISSMSGGKTDLSYMEEITKNLKKFQGEISFLIRAFFFVFLGLIYMPKWLGILYAGVIVAVNLVLRYISVMISTFKSDLYEHKRFMTLMCGSGLAEAALSVMIYNTLTTQITPVPYVFLYPLIVANIIIINNIVTSLAPILLKQKLITNIMLRWVKKKKDVTLI